MGLTYLSLRYRSRFRLVATRWFDQRCFATPVRLASGLVTVCGRVNHLGVYQLPDSTQSGHPSVGRRKSTSDSWEQTGTPRDVLAPYPWSRSVRWCLAENY